MPLRERHQGQNTAFSFIVGAQDEDDVFHRDDKEQCPYNEREDTEHIGLVHGHAVVGIKTFAQRIERACANVAKHNS